MVVIFHFSRFHFLLFYFVCFVFVIRFSVFFLCTVRFDVRCWFCIRMFFFFFGFYIVCASMIQVSRIYEKKDSKYHQTVLRSSLFHLILCRLPTNPQRVKRQAREKNLESYFRTKTNKKINILTTTEKEETHCILKGAKKNWTSKFKCRKKSEHISSIFFCISFRCFLKLYLFLFCWMVCFVSFGVFFFIRFLFVPLSSIFANECWFFVRQKSLFAIFLSNTGDVCVFQFSRMKVDLFIRWCTSLCCAGFSLV